MSIPRTVPFLVEGYGLKEEDLNEIILIERLKDITQRFSIQIKKIQDTFDFQSKMRIIEFHELSGADASSQDWFRQLILAQRHVFYSPIHSSKDCCVLFLYAGHGTKDTMFRQRILPHEFAHHFAWASEGFPILLPKNYPRELYPQFAECRKIGPEKGHVYIDNTFLADNPYLIIGDFNERIADFICEEIMREKGFWQGILEEYRVDRNRDPADDFPPEAESQFPAIIRYARRLQLRDAAEWHAILNLAQPDDPAVKKMLAYDKRWSIRLNKKHKRAKRAFNGIFEISLRTDYHSFKRVESAVRYIKNVTSLLGIEIRTEESW